MKSWVVQPVERVQGTIRVPGDKSISHRAVMLGAIADGRTEITGFLPGEDCLATLGAVEAMGVQVTRHDRTRLGIEGVGLRGLRPPASPLDMGNSGTAMRLFAGLLCAQAFDSTLVGDESLSRRPMERVAEPLRRMGAEIVTTAGCAPLRISGGRALRGIDYPMPVASAQVKSALLLAGLYAAGETVVTEPAVTRDHTERMLAMFGRPLRHLGATIVVTGGAGLTGQRIEVPGDLSSAAFMILAACAARLGAVTIDQVGLNPTRTGILDILRLMGADLEVHQRAGAADGEPVGCIVARPSALHGTAIPPALVPLAIDEFPVIFVAAALADGDTVISGAAELRHKESDRIAVMIEGLRALGVAVEERPDGARITGGLLSSGEVDSHGDHRVAMAFAAGAVRASGPVRILDTANVATSFPDFVALAGRLGLVIQEPPGA